MTSRWLLSWRWVSSRGQKHLQTGLTAAPVRKDKTSAVLTTAIPVHEHAARGASVVERDIICLDKLMLNALVAAKHK